MPFGPLEVEALQRSDCIDVWDQGPICGALDTCENAAMSGQENQKNYDYVVRKLIPTLTLTQSGLLAVLLQRQRSAVSQRSEVIQLARHRAHRKPMRAALCNTLTWPYRALTRPRLVDKTLPRILFSR